MVEIGFDLCEFSTHFDLQASFFTDKPAHAALTDINNALYIKTRGWCRWYEQNTEEEIGSN